MMRSPIYLVFYSLVGFGFFKLYGYCERYQNETGQLFFFPINCLLYISVLAVLFGFVFVMLPKRFTDHPLFPPQSFKLPSVEEGQEYLDQFVKHRDGNYTADELREMEQAERDNYNEHISACAFWAGSDTYVDYDGNVRPV